VEFDYPSRKWDDAKIGSASSRESHRRTEDQLQLPTQLRRWLDHDSQFLLRERNG
jgi:hypothetical protein